MKKGLKKIMANKKYNRPNDGKSSRSIANDSRNGRAKSRSGKNNNEKFRADTNDRTPGANDISWYSKHPDLLASVSKIPFSWQPGRSIPLGRVSTFADAQHNGKLESDTLEYNYPGICALSYIPSVGHSTRIDSPINIASKEMYAKIRSAYSGSLEADAPDLMMYMVALDSLYMLYEDYKRVYYTLNNYTYNNNMFPKHLVNAMGYDLEDLQSRKMEFYSFLVEAQAKLKKFLVPDFMPLFQRHSFMAANIYTDAPTQKSQLYVFRTAGYYKLINYLTQSELESCVRRFDDEAELMTLDDIRTEFYDALDPMFEWDTSFTINGYFQRAYSDGKFLEPAPVIMDGVLNPVYNELVLYQIKNASVNEVVLSSNCVTYTPEDNCIYCRPIYNHRAVGIDNGYFGAVYAQKKIFSLPGSEQPSDAMIVEATRLSTTTKPGFKIESWVDNYIECGTEILTRMTLYDGRGDMVYLTATDLIMYGVETPIPIATIVWKTLQALLTISTTFSHFPTIRIWGHSDELYTDGKLREPITLTSAENVTTIDDVAMENLHRVCIYSEFDCFR